MAVLNKYRDDIPDDAISIMRPSKWRNPFILNEDGDRDEIVSLHRTWLRSQIKCGRITLEELASLHGKDLVCCCAPKACHGDVLQVAAEWAHKELNKE